MAWVVTEDGVDLTPTDVKRHVAQRLPRYMVPDIVEVVEALPKTSTGKIDRPQVQRISGERRPSVRTGGPRAAGSDGSAR